MNEIELIIEGVSKTIKIEESDRKTKLKNLFEKVNELSKEGIDQFFFLNNAKRIDIEKTFDDEFSQEIAKIIILVFPIKIEEKIDKLHKSKQIICPDSQCQKYLKFEIVDFSKIKFEKCENQHTKKNDILLKDYKKNKDIDDSKIICEICKKEKKSDTYNHLFFRCISHKINMCPLCQTKHIKENKCNKNVIYYDEINYFCQAHQNEKIVAYCKVCKKNLCAGDCQKNHEHKDIEILGKITPDKKKCKENIKEIKNLKENIEKMKAKLDKVIVNLDYIYEIYNDMIDNFIENEDRNYETYTNIGLIQNIKENKVLEEAQSINQNKDIINQFKSIIDIYNKIEKNEKEIKNTENKNKEKIENNNNQIENNDGGFVDENKNDNQNKNIKDNENKLSQDKDEKINEKQKKFNINIIIIIIFGLLSTFTIYQNYQLKKNISNLYKIKYKKDMQYESLRNKTIIIEEENKNLSTFYEEAVENVTILTNENAKIKKEVEIMKNNYEKFEKNEYSKTIEDYNKCEISFNELKESNGNLKNAHDNLKNKYEKLVNDANNKTIIGIDLGSTSSAYTIINSDDDLNNFEWEFENITSEIILDSNYSCNPSEIGKVAHYIQKNDFKFQNRAYFSFFKKELDPKENNNNRFNIEVEATSPKDSKIYLSKIFEGYLTLIRKKINIDNRNRIKHLNNTKWILTIPPLWDKEGKEFMKNIAQLSGMNDIDIALEPEASSLAIFDSLDIEGNKINLKKGDTFLLVDAGGYTVDFSGFKILDDNNNLEQLIVSESMKLGSNIINEKIIDIIKFTYEESFIENIKKNNYDKWEKILKNIEDRKLDAYGQNGIENIKVTVNFDNFECSSNCWFKYFFCKNQCIKKTYEGTEINFNEHEIFINTSLINSTILNIARNLSHKISSINNQLKNENIQNVIMTGGFSQCLILKNNFTNIWEEEEKSAITLKFLKNPKESVAKGAAIFGLRPNQILKIKCPITIGVLINKIDFNEKDEDCEKSGDDEENIELITFAKRHDTIMVNETKTEIINTMSNEIDIYYTRKEKFTDNSKDRRKLGSIKFEDIPTKRRKISISMKFSTYYIKVIAVNKETNEEISQVIMYP